MRLMYLVTAAMLFTAEAVADVDADVPAVGRALGQCEGAASAILLLLDHYDWPDLPSADDRQAVETTMKLVSFHSRHIAENIARSLAGGPEIGFSSAGSDVAFLNAVSAGVMAGRDGIAAVATAGSLSGAGTINLVNGCTASLAEAKAMVAEIGLHVDRAMRQRGLTK